MPTPPSPAASAAALAPAPKGSQRQRDRPSYLPPVVVAPPVDRSPAQRALLRRLVDLAFAKEDLIMTSTKTGSAVGLGVADYFAAGLPSLIGKSIEGSVCAGVRTARRVQSTQMFACIRACKPAELAKLAKEAAAQGEPSFDWLKGRIQSGVTGAGAAAASAAGSAAASAAGSVAAMVGDEFTDYISDAILDQALSIAPFGIGAAKAGAQVVQVTQRITELRAKIQTLLPQAGV